MAHDGLPNFRLAPGLGRGGAASAPMLCSGPMAGGIRKGIRPDGGHMIRLVLSDLDSTLIWSENHVITRHALEAIHALQEADVCFAPATGRIFADLGWMFDGDEKACSTAVTSNGQLIYLDGRLVHSVSLDTSALQRVADSVSDAPDAFLVVEYGKEKYAVDAPRATILAHPELFWHVDLFSKGVPEQPCFKANVRVLADMDRGEEVRAMLAAACPELSFVFPMPGLPHIDITPAGWDKAQAGDWLMGLLGLSPEEVCCFGDADNDVALLGHYPNSVAVANATQQASRAARWHVGPACRDSVADTLAEIARAARTGDMPSFMRG